MIVLRLNSWSESHKLKFHSSSRTCFPTDGQRGGDSSKHGGGLVMVAGKVKSSSASSAMSLVELEVLVVSSVVQDMCI